MLPRFGSSKLVRAWIVATIVASVATILSGGLLGDWLAFCPELVWRGQVWRLVTWTFVETGPISLVVTCASIYKFGGELAIRWGDRRLRRFMLEVVVGACAAAALLAILDGPAWWMSRTGGLVVPEVLVIAWARQFPEATLVMYYGLLALRGRAIVRITVAVAVLYALYGGPFRMAPELLACTAAAMYPASRLTRGRGWS